MPPNRHVVKPNSAQDPAASAALCGSRFDRAPSDCYYVDCVRFRNPETINLCKHLGFHHLICKSVIAHKAFVPEMTAILAHIKGNPSARIFFQCNAGKHRSVAMANLTRQVLRTKGVPSAITFLSEWNWSTFQLACKDENCTPCAKAPDNFRIAVAAWD